MVKYFYTSLKTLNLRRFCACFSKWHTLIMTRVASCLLGIVTCATPMASQAQSSFDVYGQVNFGLFSTDDGFQSENYFSDNDNSNTRFGLNWRHDFDGGRLMRFNFETGLGLDGSSSVTIEDTDLAFDYDRQELRKFEFIYTTPDIGTVNLGQGSMATDGVAEADFSGTSVIAYSGIADLAGSIEFRNAAGMGAGIDIADVFKSFDGSRRFRLRYDTPSWSGFVFSIAGGNEVLNEDDENEYYDISGKYATGYGDVKVDARLGYSWVSGGEELLSGSAAVFHVPTGLNFALSSGAQQKGNDSYVYGKFGWEQDWFAVGSTSLSIDFFDGNDYAADGSESKSVGIAVVQAVNHYNIEFYTAWRRHEFSKPDTTYSDIDVFALGARWKF